MIALIAIPLRECHFFRPVRELWGRNLFGGPEIKITRRFLGDSCKNRACHGTTERFPLLYCWIIQEHKQSEFRIASGHEPDERSDVSAPNIAPAGINLLCS